MLGTTVDALVQRVKRDAAVSSRGPIYTVATAILAADTEIEVNETPSHVGGQGVGAVLSIDYELIYVKSVSTATKTFTVIRGFLGTTAADHAEDSLVEIDPRHPAAMILDDAQKEIQSWGKQLWQATTVEVATLSTHRAFDLGVTGDIYFLLDVRAMPVGSSTDLSWHANWTRDAWPHVDAKILRDADATTFPSGVGLQTRIPMRSTTLRVTVAQPLDLSTFTAATDLVADVGCQPDWLEIVELGARYRTLQSLSVGRVDWRRGSMSRDSEEVSVFDVMRSADQARAQRDLLFTRAGVDLRADYPFRDE